MGGVFGRVRACRGDGGAGGVLGAGGEGAGVGVCLMGWSWFGKEGDGCDGGNDDDDMID